MTNVKTYERPSTLEEAWNLLDEGGREAKLVGGGIDVALFTPREITTLVDLSRLSNQTIEDRPEGLCIGAGATLTQLLESDEAAPYLDGILVSTLRQVASPLLRNAATIGGALASTHPWSDIITLLLALNAEIKQFDGDICTSSLEKLLAQRGTIDRKIITEATLPQATAGTYVAFEKFVRTGFDVAMLNCAIRLCMVDGVCKDVRVVLGGTPEMGSRIEAVEEALDGVALDSERIDAMAQLASEAIPARDDVRASAAYRRVLAAAGVRRCLVKIATKAGE